MFVECLSRTMKWCDSSDSKFVLFCFFVFCFYCFVRQFLIFFLGSIQLDRYKKIIQIFKCLSIICCYLKFNKFLFFDILGNDVVYSVCIALCRQEVVPKLNHVKYLLMYHVQNTLLQFVTSSKPLIACLTTFRELVFLDDKFLIQIADLIHITS